MKKPFLALIASLALGTAVPVLADNQIYLYYDEEDNYMYGCLRRFSPNGLWACGGDETDETGSIIIRTDDPTHYTTDPDGLLLDIDNSGMAVGAWYEQPGGGAKYKRAALYKDGQWIRLPLPEQIIGQSYAVAISADSKTIVGHGMCRNDAPDEPGKYFPMVWRLNEATGDYDLEKLYNALWLPGTLGFFIEDLSPDGRYACGYQSLDMSDTVAAMLDLQTGEYKIWHEIEYKDYVFKAHDGLYEANGMFVDGLLDGFDVYTRFGGAFTYATDRYLFGSRATVSDVQEDGSGVIYNRAAVYDLLTGEFQEDSNEYLYMSGQDFDNAFTNTGMMMRGGELIDVSDFVGSPVYIATMYDYNTERDMLVGSHISTTPWGVLYESPVFVTLDTPVFAGIDNVRADSDVSVSIDGRQVSVTGGKEVNVYGINGALLSKSAVSTLSPGVYVIAVDGVARKVVVK